MCGRYALYSPTSRIREQFDLDEEFDFVPRYNIAPTTKALIVRSGSQSWRVAGLCRWGLIPVWAKDAAIGTKLINARGETVAEKPAFRTAFRHGRCIVPANGFYEWKSVQEGGRTVKQPYYIRSNSNLPLVAPSKLLKNHLMFASANDQYPS
jgi:putative SOS response-associated peptidase YedK